MEKRKIAVIGSGGWGTAISVLLSGLGHSVTLWSWQQAESERLAQDRENKEFLPGIPLGDGIACTHDISCVKGKDLVVLAPPSKSMRGTAHAMAPYLDVGTVVVILSKGLEEGSHQTLSQVVAEELPGARIVVMSGPSHAEEVARGIPTANVAASDDEAAAKYVQDTCMCPNFRIYTSRDMLGVQLGGALKNVIALCAGIVDGIGFGDNTKAALMTRGIKEIARLGEKMGADVETFYGLSGIGDLIVTCTSMHSRNRRAGILIGQGVPLAETLERVHMVVEGVQSAGSAYALAKEYGVEMPIVAQANAVLYDGKSPKQALVDLMMRDKKEEIV